MAVSALPRVTIRDRAIARQAEESGRRILRMCNGLLSAHEIAVAEPVDVPDGKPLVSLLLHRLSVEAHAYYASRVGTDLAKSLRSEAKRLRGENRTAVLRIAATVERL